MTVEWHDPEPSYSVVLFQSSSAASCTKTGTLLQTNNTITKINPPNSYDGQTYSNSTVFFVSPTSNIIYCAYTRYYSQANRGGTLLANESTTVPAAVSLDVTPALATTLNANKTTINTGQTVKLWNVTSGGTGSNVYRYTLNNLVGVTEGTGASANVFTFNNAGSYLVTLTVNDISGEVATSAITITVLTPAFTLSCPGSTLLSAVSNSNTLANGPDTSGWMPAVPTYAGNPAWTASIPGATWIWDSYLVSNPSIDQIVQFSRTLNVPGKLISAYLTLSTDNDGTFAVNSNTMPSWATSTMSYQSATTFNVTNTMNSGSNLLNFSVRNIGISGSSPQGNPAGLLYNLSLCYQPKVPITTKLIANQTYISADQAVAFTNNTAGGVGKLTYAYKVTPAVGFTENGNTFTFTSAGTYNVMLTANDAYGDVASSNVLIRVTPPLGITLSANRTTIVTGNKVLFTNTSAGGTGSDSYVYSVNNTSGVSILGSSVTGSNVIQFANKGKYNVMVTVTDLSGETASANVIITVNYTVKVHSTSIVYPGSETSGTPTFSQDQTVTDDMQIQPGIYLGIPPYTYTWEIQYPGSGTP